MNNCYVFFVLSGSEKSVCGYLNDKMGIESQLTFSPKKEVIYKNSGKVRIILKDMFPGYVFSKTDLSPIEFIHEASLHVRRSSKIIRLLGMYTPDTMAMGEKERAFMLQLCDDQFIVRKSTGIIIGDRIIVKDGPLAGHESIITRINRHKQRAEIEIPFMGDVRRTSVSLEIVKKIV